MDPIEVLQQLKDRPRLSVIEAYHSVSFEGTRHRKDRSVQHFTLTIRDAGPTLHPEARYSCTVETDDGLKVTGNPNTSVLGALYILQALERT